MKYVKTEKEKEEEEERRGERTFLLRSSLLPFVVDLLS